jgi:hypothetical protein
MIVPAGHDILGSSGAAAAPRRLAPARKSADSGPFERKPPPHPAPRDGRRPAGASPGSCHSGTERDGSRWDAPVLAAPFAAQVIGQALGLRRIAGASARIAYRPLQGKNPGAMLLDDRL